MKKRILLIIMILLLTTGCTFEYNLIIDGSNYKEEIVITAESSDEISSFNQKWEIPIDKDEYEKISGFDNETDINTKIYKYSISSNKLTFNNNFNISNISKSTAAYNCYNKLTVSNYNNTTIISTSPKADCFDKHPPLTSVKVNIKVDREVISNNADNISGNTYTWNITKETASSKSINLVLSNGNKEEDKTDPSSDNTNNKTKKNDYTLYIFLIILVLIIFLGYKWFMKFKDKNNNID